MGCCISTVACCFCSSAASLCCSACPSCRSSTSTRLMYSLLFLLSTILSCIMLAPGMKTLLAKVPALCDTYKIDTSIGKIDTGVKSGFNCDLVLGFGAVYRVEFGATAFFVLMALLTIKVRHSKDIRATLHNGFWFFKLLALILLWVGAFFIPASSDFTTVWMIFGMCGSLLFIIIQLVLLIDFAHCWNERWTEGYEESGSNWYYCGLLFFTVLFYSAAIALTVLLYVYYGANAQCVTNQALISVNLIFCIIASAMSVLPAVQEHQRSGLLQGGLISLYVMYLTWSAVSSSTLPACNPTLTLNNYTRHSPEGSSKHSETSVGVGFELQTWATLAVFIVAVLYSTLRTSAHSSVGRLDMNTRDGMENPILLEPVETNDNSSGQDKEGQTIVNDEEECVTYSYCMLHVMLALASLYVMMTITNWYSPSSNLQTMQTNNAALWIKTVSSWLCLLLYVWTLWAPVVLQDRDFS